MPLIKCPDCGKEFSDQARACPNCGRPFGQHKSLLTKNLGVDGFVFGMMIVFGLFVAPQPYAILLIAAGLLLLVVKLIR